MRQNVAIASLSRIAVLTLPFAVAGQTADPWLGTWQLDLAQSKCSLGPGPQRQTLTIEPVAGGVPRPRNSLDSLLHEGE